MHQTKYKKIMIDKINILIVDDFLMSGLGIKALLIENTRFNVCDVLISGYEALDYIKSNDINILLTDALMPNMDGVELLKEVKKKSSDIKVILVTINDDREYILSALAHDADGYIFKDISKKDLNAAILKVNGGEFAFSPKIIEPIIEDIRIYAKNHHLGIPINHRTKPKLDKPITKIDEVKRILTEREIEVLDYIGNGKSTKEIASICNVSPYTVSTHRKNIYSKLHISELATMVKIANEISANVKE